SQLSDQARTDLTAMLGALTKTLASARGQVDNATGLVASSYASIMTAQRSFVSDFSNGLLDRDLATTVGVHASVLAYAAALITEEQAGLAVLGAPGNVVAVDTYVTAQAATDVARKAAAGAVDGLGITDAPLAGAENTTSKMRSDLANGDPAVTATITAEAWTSAIGVQLDAASTAETAVLARAATQAQDAEQAALVQLVVTFVTMLVVGVASWVLASLVARSIVRPLRRLTDTAGEVRKQLPRLVEQVAVPGEGPNIELPRITVESDDEIGRLAAAFNDVNATTIQVAQEQAALRGSIAEMFVNVARRDQVLLNRQLAFVDSLERSEEDPTVLANLFHLDHLATRMRRNAESLLVLAGIDSGRRLRESMPLSDVIRTASSEIEQYDRVELDLNVDPLMLGFNALPAAHMLAELLENASVFSEPDTPVEVSTGMEGQFVTVTVLDHGIGMTEAELASVNDKLAFTSPADSLGAQRLGLFVVARLANRLGAKVSVRQAPGGTGTETLVRFPVALFAGLEPEAMPPARPPRTPETSGVPAPALSADLEAALAAQEVPEVRAVDLTALTDGSTEQGLPRRRQGLVPDDLESSSFVLPEAITPVDLSTDLQATNAGWAPMIVSSETAGLPSRRRDGEPEQSDVPLLDLTPAKPVDPEDRRGLFTGFRGWSRQQDEQDAAGLPADAQTSAPSAPEDTAPAEVEAAPMAPSPLASRPRMRSRRGAHAAPSASDDAQAPFGYTHRDVAAWQTGQIPVVSPGSPDSDWPSPAWDSADWKPAGLFVRNDGADGPLVPAFDPIALEPDEDEAPYVPVLEPEAPSAQFGEPSAQFGEPLAQAGVPVAADWAAEPGPLAWPVDPAALDVPEWAAEPAEPGWQPVMDLSDAPLTGEPVTPTYEGWTTPSWGDSTAQPAGPTGFAADGVTTPADAGPYAFTPTVDPFAAAPVAAPVPTDFPPPVPAVSEAPIQPSFARPEPVGPTPAAQPEPGSAPISPAWPSVSGPGAQVPSSASAATVPIEAARGKKRFGLFGRKAKPEVTAVPTAVPAPAAEQVAPVWAPTETVPGPVEPTWSAPTSWAATPAEPAPDATGQPAWGAPAAEPAPAWGSAALEP
ncbi:MAG: HAMP domain-containing protein, partial [Actinobacteria bacterium]|nr:HAMP domain-containing protein [Actinomycetota bacterium]